MLNFETENEDWRKNCQEVYGRSKHCDFRRVRDALAVRESLLDQLVADMVPLLATGK